MNKIARLPVLMTLPLLAGCFGFEQTLSVTSNGTATFVTEVAFLTEMMGSFFGEEGGDEFCSSDDLPTDLPPGAILTAEETIRDGDTVCTMTGVGPIATLVEVIASGAFLPTDDDGGSPVISLVDEGGGVFAYTVNMSSQGEEAGLGEEEQAFMAMMGPMFEGRSFLWTVTAPRILETNGERNGNTVILEVPALEVLTEAGFEYELFVRFAL